MAGASDCVFSGGLVIAGMNYSARLNSCGFGECGFEGLGLRLVFVEAGWCSFGAGDATEQLVSITYRLAAW